MGTRLNAGFVLAQVEDDNVLVGFADAEYETREHLLLQRDLAPTAQDLALGHDRVHITYGDQIQSAYGVIQVFSLTDGEATVVLDTKTAEAVGTDEVIKIEFPPGAVEMARLKQCLELLFEGQPGTLVYMRA